METYIIGITGASGTIYALRLIEELIKREYKIITVISEPGIMVMENEIGLNLHHMSAESVTEKMVSYLQQSTDLSHHQIQGYFSYLPVDKIDGSIASGSFKTSGMIVVPCSMATISALAVGRSRNLLERAADVILKEERKLITVPRETPLSTIHLENMLKLSRIGVSIIPAMPAFYHNPRGMDELINFVIGKILDNLRIEHDLFTPWE